MSDINYTYNSSTPFGLLLYQSAQQLEAARKGFYALKVKYDDVTAGGTQTANLELPTETRFGIPAGKGQAAYNAVVAILAAINPSGAPIPSATDLFQG